MRFPLSFKIGAFAPLLLATLWLGGIEPAHAQSASASKMKPARDLIRRQDPPKINKRVLERVTKDNSNVIIILSRQRVFLMTNGEIAIDSPISSGKSAGMTPTGSFKITQKDADHRSNIYGNFVDAQGRIVRAGVSTRIDSAPSGTRFVGAPMKYFMRFDGAVGMHVGILPGYPASHGCVRLPEEIAPLIYHRVKNGTSVEVLP